MKTALITGISGQDGPYLARLLLSMNYRVIGTVRSYRHANTKNFDYLSITDDLLIEELDLWDVTSVFRILKKYEPDEIYNLAAQSSVSLSFTQPIGTFSFNTSSVNNLLESIRLFNPKIKFYQASSSEMYGHIKDLPIKLSSPMNPVSPYAVSKMASHFMGINYREAYGLFICNGVLFNHESVLRSENFFVKKVIQQAFAIKKGLHERLFVGNLNIRRDFGYAPLYIEAIWKMMQLDNAEDFIICSGKSVVLKDIVEYVFDKLGVNPNLIIEDSALFRPNEIYEIYGDNSKAKEKLDWNYELSFFEVLDKLIEEEISFNNF